MATAKLILVCIFILIENSRSNDIQINEHYFLQSTETRNGLNLFYKNVDGLSEKIGIIGNYLKDYSDIKRVGNSLIVRFSHVNLTITSESDEHGQHINLKWETIDVQRLIDCHDLGNDQWFGGPQQKRQYWPIQNLKLAEYSYVSKEADNAAITEPYWLSSRGAFIYVNKKTPLFVDQNNVRDNYVCFIANISAPYSNKREKNILSYSVGRNANARISHMYVVKKFLGKPIGYPDYRITQHPIWSTWAKYKIAINESTIIDFANKILENKFNNSQLEVDDLWETCYGSFNVDTKKFPDLKRLNLQLKDMGFRVTFWIHPFINKECEPWYTEALNNRYFVESEDGKVDTSWWNSNGPNAAYIDFTKENATKWWASRLKNLQTTYAIDSFKFDAGESSWSPQVPLQIGDVNEHPTHITREYVKTCAKFGPMVEVRAGQRTQDLPIYVRMIDKDSEWDFENGLPTLITTLLQMNMNGYPLVLPDMIGGNGYNGAPSKEMFIRWLQANTFMPSLQYSYVPWDYDSQTIEISHKYTDLHEKYTPNIIRAFEKAVKSGEPVNPPIWWIDPMDQEALKVWDEYLLGEDVLVAPVIVKGAISRDVYLPRGKWLAEGRTDSSFEGPRWIRNYSAPIDSLPYFIKST